jgi:hypothetical protein
VGCSACASVLWVFFVSCPWPKYPSALGVSELLGSSTRCRPDFRFFPLASTAPVAFCFCDLFCPVEASCHLKNSGKV